MSVRDGPMIPMTTSGHCAYGPDHTKCHKVGCTCSCHQREQPAPAATPEPKRRTRKKLI